MLSVMQCATSVLCWPELALAAMILWFAQYRMGQEPLSCALALADTSLDTQLKTAAINQDALDEQAASMATPATA